jgi:alpha-amylase
MWIPPACKGQNDQDMGYGIYGMSLRFTEFKVDLWDLGEFNQKGTIRTKWGTSDELTALSKVATDQGMSLYFDAVLNHKASADEQFKCPGIQVDWNGISRMRDGITLDRNRTIGDVREINPWVHFLFPGRRPTYSNMEWNWDHFTGVDIVTFCSPF